MEGGREGGRERGREGGKRERGTHPVSRIECPQDDVSCLKESSGVVKWVVLYHNHDILWIRSGRGLVPRPEGEKMGGADIQTLTEHTR